MIILSISACILIKYLSWNTHIQRLSKKLSRANGILSKLWHNDPLETCLQVYYVIFYSHVTYGCSTKGENLKKNEVLQKKCLRIMTFSDFNSHTNSLFTDLKFLKVQDIVKSQQLKLVCEFFDKVLPDDLQTLFDHTRDIHNVELNSFHKNLLHIPSIKTATYGNKSKNFFALNYTFRYGIAIDRYQEKCHF